MTIIMMMRINLYCKIIYTHIKITQLRPFETRQTFCTKTMCGKSIKHQKNGKFSFLLLYWKFHVPPCIITSANWANTGKKSCEMKWNITTLRKWKGIKTNNMKKTAPSRMRNMTTKITTIANKQSEWAEHEKGVKLD